MKSVQTIALGALVLAAGCVSSAPGIAVTGVYGTFDKNACVLDTGAKAQVAGGSANLAVTWDYYMGFKLSNTLESNDQYSANGRTTINPKERNAFTLQSISLEYICKDTAPRCKSFPKMGTKSIARAGVIPAGSDLWAAMNLLDPSAAEKLAAFVEDLPVSIAVSVTFHGELASGATLETVPFEFPLSLYYSVPARWDSTTMKCTTSLQIDAANPPPCGNYGQDGWAVVCSTS